MCASRRAYIHNVSAEGAVVISFLTGLDICAASPWLAAKASQAEAVRPLLSDREQAAQVGNHAARVQARRARVLVMHSCRESRRTRTPCRAMCFACARSTRSGGFSISWSSRGASTGSSRAAALAVASAAAQHAHSISVSYIAFLSAAVYERSMLRCLLFAARSRCLRC